VLCNLPAVGIFWLLSFLGGALVLVLCLDEVEMLHFQMPSVLLLNSLKPRAMLTEQNSI